MPEDAPPPPPPMQFDVAQYSGDQRPPVSACTACKKPIAQTYYTANQAVICPECSQQIARQLTGGSGFGRFCRALGLGIVGGLAGALLWFAVRRVTGYEVGLVAIVVGLLVAIVAMIRAIAKPKDAPADRTTCLLFLLLIAGLSALACVRMAMPARS